MWKYLSYNIFGNCLPGKKVFILVFTQQAGNSEVSKILGICKKAVPLNQRILYIIMFKGVLIRGKLHHNSDLLLFKYFLLFHFLLRTNAN